MAQKSVVVTTTNDTTTQHLRKVNVLTAAVAGTSLAEWASVTSDGHNTFETVVSVTPALTGARTVIVPVGGGGGGTWSPVNLGAVVRAWYKFDALTGANGDPQGSITDSSGNAFTLTQAGTLRATLAAADLNSKNTIRFTAASSQRYPLSSTIMSGSSAGSFYLVQKVVSAAVANGSPQWGAGSQDYTPFSDGNIYEDFGSAARNTVGTPTGALTSYRIISAYSAANDWAYFIDGGTGGPSGGTTAKFSTATNTVTWTGVSTWLGANTGLTYFDGWYAEVVYTNAKQSTTDRQKMEGYLASKWGLQGNLDATHPYKSSAP